MPTNFDPSKLDENSGANMLFANFASTRKEAAQEKQEEEPEKSAPNIDAAPCTSGAADSNPVEPIKEDGTDQQLSSDEYGADKLVQINAKIPQSLYEAWEDKMYHVRKKYGVKLKKLDVIRDGVTLFANGTDYRCPNGHRFIVAEGGDDLQQVHCPVCGDALPNASLYRGVHSLKS